MNQWVSEGILEISYENYEISYTLIFWPSDPWSSENVYAILTNIAKEKLAIILYITLSTYWHKILRTEKD